MSSPPIVMEWRLAIIPEVSLSIHLSKFAKKNEANMP
jgi:hypothetical protein